MININNSIELSDNNKACLFYQRSRGVIMRIGTVISIPNEYSQYGRVLDENGIAYTVEPDKIPDAAEIDDDLAYKVELWGNDSGLIFDADFD